MQGRVEVRRGWGVVLIFVNNDRWLDSVIGYFGRTWDTAVDNPPCPVTLPRMMNANTPIIVSKKSKKGYRNQ